MRSNGHWQKWSEWIVINGAPCLAASKPSDVRCNFNICSTVDDDKVPLVNLGRADTCSCTRGKGDVARVISARKIESNRANYVPITARDWPAGRWSRRRP